MRIQSLSYTITIGFLFILCQVFINNYFHVLSNPMNETRSQTLTWLKFSTFISISAELIDFTNLNFKKQVNDSTIHVING